MTAPLAVSLAGRDFLRIADFLPAEAEAILERAVALRAEPKQPLLQGATLGLYFSKHSTRTRVSFSAGMAQLGGVAIPLTPEELSFHAGNRCTTRHTPSPATSMSSPSERIRTRSSRRGPSTRRSP